LKTARGMGGQCALSKFQIGLHASHEYVRVEALLLYGQKELQQKSHEVECFLY